MPPSSTTFCAPSQELEHEGIPRPAERLKNGSPAAEGRGHSNVRAKGELPLGSFDDEACTCTRCRRERLRQRLAAATNDGKVTRYFGPPTDPALDASRDNDHRTRWVSGLSGVDLVLITIAGALIVASFVLAIVGTYA